MRIPAIRYSLPVVLSLAATLTVAEDFHPPGEGERRAALGPLQDLPEAMRRAFDPGEDFEAIPAPKANDWLASHPEPGQTFEAFLAKKNRSRAAPQRKIIYLQPFGDFPEARSPSTESLRALTAVYFGMETKLLPAISVEGLHFTTREGPRGGPRQILTGDVTRHLKQSIPADARCVVAITLEDLFPGPDWNYVFGEAELGGRTGVFSFARYDPRFHGEERTKDSRRILLVRSAQVLLHETGHLLGLQHCVYYRCVMNGSNHLKESDSQPLHLCPICLRKLQSACAFDPLERHRRLARAYRELGLEDEARWEEKRVQRIEGPVEPKIGAR